MDYSTADRDQLLSRIASLEDLLKARDSLRADGSCGVRPHSSLTAQSTSAKSSSQKPREVVTLPVDFFERYGSRKIALKFCYEGWHFGGLALQNDDTPLPTVEGVLLDALIQARLIKSKDALAKLEFSRCGRTDKGVSAAGQVISLYVRSQLSVHQGSHEPAWRPPLQTDHQQQAATDTASENDIKQRQAALLAEKEELPYMQLLNRVLPPSIRILGWSPVSPDFDARFSCTSRHYKYFFSDAPNARLNIATMSDAARRLIGEHDFRNFCKIDPTKQLINLRRRIISAHISKVPSDAQAHDTYVFDLVGTAFLYHQVRHIMAILFLVGSGAEQPDIVPRLLNTGYGIEGERLPITATYDSVVASKPGYEMANDLPLVLWDCMYPDGSFNWHISATIKDENEDYAHCSINHIKSTISAHFLAAGRALRSATLPNGAATNHRALQIQIGAGNVIRQGKYVPLMQRPRSDLVENINLRWLNGQGRRRSERKTLQIDERSHNND